MSKDNNSKDYIVYIDLDCLLDTRIGTLLQYNEEIAKNAIDGAYEYRDIDEFDGLSFEEFKELYKKRNVDTLAITTFTNVFYLMGVIIKNSLEIDIEINNGKSVEFCINTYPYDLNQEEMTELTNAVAYRLKHAAKVSALCIPDLELTPTYCKANYDIMIRYEFNDWLHMHIEKFQETPIPKVVLIAPALYAVKPTKEQFKELEANNQHPMRAAEIMFAPLIGLKLYDPEVFSINRGISPSNPEIARVMREVEEKTAKAKPPTESTSAVDDDGFELL